MLKYATLTIDQQIGEQVLLMHPVIVYNENELVLFDVGYPNQLEKIESELLKLGFTLQDISKIVISHQDHDHVGSLKEFRDQIKEVEIISSIDEAPYIDGSRKSLRLSQAEAYNKTLKGSQLEFGIKFVNYLKTIQPCKVDRVVEDGDVIIEGLKVIATPGHTPGHISLLIEDASVVLAGDALVVKDNQLEIANPEFTLDMDICISSIRRLKGLDPRKIICYHGGSVEKNMGNLLDSMLLD